VQASFSDLEYDAKKRLTRRDRFLAEIESANLMHAGRQLAMKHGRIAS